MTIFDIWEVSLDGISQLLIHTWTFLAINYVASQLFFCLFWISLWLGIDVYNTLASKICVKLLKPPKIQIPTPNTSFRICLHIHDVHSMLFALPGYQFPYTVMNRCLYLRRWRTRNKRATSHLHTFNACYILTWCLRWPETMPSFHLCRVFLGLVCAPDSKHKLKEWFGAPDSCQCMVRQKIMVISIEHSSSFCWWVLAINVWT
jgi:hypothetical protein